MTDENVPRVPQIADGFLNASMGDTHGVGTSFPVPTDDNPNPIKLAPHEWAVRKGLLALHPTGAVNFRKVVPWDFNLMAHVHQWPDPNLDPTFKISESEFIKAHETIKKVRG